jgi:hypothetical protein
MSQYVIWGIAPNSEHESLLVSENAGIESAKHAQKVCADLESHHGCTATRVQELEHLSHVGLSNLASQFRNLTR